MTSIPKDKPTNILTIDFEDWYHGMTSTSTRIDEWGLFEKHLEGPTRWLLDTLGNHGVRATFFILGVVAREHPGLVRAISAAGHDIGLHGDMHRHVRTMSQNEFREDIARNKAAVEEVTGQAAMSFRAPCFSLSAKTPWVWEELARAGIVADSSLFPVRTPLYGLPSAPRRPFIVPTTAGNVVEVPISTVRFAGVNFPFSGGFYFRVLPYELVSSLTRHLNASGQTVVFYFHPWEFDPGHPRPACTTARERLSHYACLAGMRAKFLRLLQEVSLEPICSLPQPTTCLINPCN